MHLKALSREVESVGLLPRRYSSQVVLVYSPGGIPRGWSWSTPPEVFLAGGLGLLPRRYSSRVVLVYSPGGIPRGWSWFTPPEVFLVGGLGLLPWRYSSRVVLVFSSGRDLISVTLAFIQDEILSRSPWFSSETSRGTFISTQSTSKTSRRMFISIDLGSPLTDVHLHPVLFENFSRDAHLLST